MFNNLLNKKLKEKIKFQLIEDCREGDLVIVEVDTGDLPKAKAERYMRTIQSRIRESDVKSQWLVVPKGVSVKKIFRNEILKEGELDG